MGGKRLFMCLSLFVISFLPPNLAGTVDKVLKSMSLEAKIGQMVQIDIAKFMVKGTTQVNQTYLQDYIVKYQIGSLLNSPFSGGPVEGITGWTATEWRTLLSQIQSYADETSSGIPIIYGIDSIHGATFVKDAALFPQALNLAATFSPDLAYLAGQITAKDTRAAGIPWIFAPVLGLGLQPLWARFPETFGEDMYVAATMGSSIIKGMQDLVDDGGVPKRAAACMKHFIAYSFPTNGHDRAPVQLPDRILRQLYLPSFQAAIDAGVLTAMESYQEVGGIPMVSSKDYLLTLIRKEMGFQGFMVTDYQEIENLHDWHKVSATQRDAVKLAMQETSIDMSMVPLDSSFYEFLLDLVRSGEVSEERINESVKRILKVKETLGILDRSANDLSVDDPLVATVGQESDWEASLNTARESIILAKTDNTVLPITDGKKIFLTGPTCNSSISQTGGWAIHWQGVFYESEQARSVSILQGLTKLNLLPNSDITYLSGPGIDDKDLSAVDMDAAYAAMDAADVVILCVGEGSYAEKPGDIDDLTLAKGQSDYLEQLSQHDTSKKIVSIMVAGRPRLFPTIVGASSAVVLAMQPGPLGGQAVAEALSGVLNPSGRLPFSYPRYSGDVLYPYHHKPSEQCTHSTGFHTANYTQCSVQFPFGYGYSYTTWQYSNLVVSKTNFNETGYVDITVDVTNAGSLAGKHTVMLFLYDMYRRVTPEYKRLVRYEKISLDANTMQTVAFTLTAEDLQYIGIDSEYILESGEFRVGLSPYVDCRADENINSDSKSFYIVEADTMSTSAMCASLHLDLSFAYSPVCDKACILWNSVGEGSESNSDVTSSIYDAPGAGICGKVISDVNYCHKVCTKQQWSWDYVQCITDYYQNSACTDYDTVQCYDPFSLQSNHATSTGDDSGSDDDNYTYSLLVIMCVLSGLLGLVIGGGIFFIHSVYFSSKSSHRPLLQDDVFEKEITRGSVDHIRISSNSRV